MRRVHTISFYHAFSGLFYAVRTQPNFLVHLVLSSLAVSLGIYLHITHTEWMFLVVIIALGLVIELLNTAIESTVDLMTDQYNLFAKVAKDTASAAMLVYSFGAIILAALIFVPKLWPFS